MPVQGCGCLLKSVEFGSGIIGTTEDLAGEGDIFEDDGG